MSYANEHPELVPERAVAPSWPPPDTIEDILVDFLAWMREEKGLRVCRKTRNDPQGRSVYSRAARSDRVDAAQGFVSKMGVAPYRPPEPLVTPDTVITGLKASTDEAVSNETTKEDSLENLF